MGWIARGSLGYHYQLVFSSKQLLENTLVFRFIASLMYNIWVLIYCLLLVMYVNLNWLFVWNLERLHAWQMEASHIVQGRQWVNMRWSVNCCWAVLGLDCTLIGFLDATGDVNGFFHSCWFLLGLATYLSHLLHCFCPCRPAAWNRQLGLVLVFGLSVYPFPAPWSLARHFYLFLAVPYSLWDLNSLTRDRTQALLDSESAEPKPLDRQGICLRHFYNQ